MSEYIYREEVIVASGDKIVIPTVSRTNRRQAMVKPILFNTDMVKAILDGRKTVTRRLIKPQPKTDSTVTLISTFDYATISYDDGIYAFPYQPGNILYVRETWANISDWIAVDPDVGVFDGYIYKADWDNSAKKAERPKWKPSIHMPKEAARIFLRVTNVSVAKLQNMTDADVEAEGISLDKWYEYDEWQHSVGDGLAADGTSVIFETMRGYFGHTIWDPCQSRANYEKYRWDNNPWVSVIEFQRTEKPNEA